ncbi:hypothetical protein AB5N19_03038 [Seiridium cardinale]
MAIVDILTGGLDGFTLSIIIGSSLIVLLWRIFTLRLDSREPPVLKAGIPVIGHILGMLRESHGYWTKLYESQPMPACTLPMINGKMYIINDPALISATFRARSLSFDPYLLKTIESMIPISAKTAELFKSDDFFHPWTKIVYSKMTGTDLSRMNVVVLTDIFDQINLLPLNMEVEDTYIWFRNTLTISTIVSLLGKANPWKKDRSLIAKFWEWESCIHHFVLGPAPWLTSPSAYKARAGMHSALTECKQISSTDQLNFSSSAPTASDVSGLIKATTAMQEEHHWTAADKAAMMIAILQGAVSNTVPTAYWYFMHILTSPSLVAKLRKELEPLVVRGATLPNGKREMLVDIRGLEEKAPLLVAAFRENQRVIGVGTISRWVVSDTLLTSTTDPGQTYLLKKDTPLQISSMLNHTAAAYWGADVAEFKADRFLRTDTRTGEEREFEGDAPVQRGAFTPFGGGKHLCPGRNFASAENWGTMIAFVLGFDITTPEGGPLELPERTMPLPTHGIGRPVEGADLRSSVRRRKGWENVVWKVADVPANKGT